MPISRYLALTLALPLFLCGLRAQRTFTLDLTPAPAHPPIRRIDPVTGHRDAAGIHEAYVYWVPAARAAAAGPSPTMLICPGGGYHVLAFEKEGLEVARRLAAGGVSCAVLMSRLPATEHVPYPKLVALDDARAALRMLRAHADTFGIDTARLGAMGFSAGGHLAMLLATLDDPAERPRASVLVYPVISMTAPWTHAGSREALLGPAPPAAFAKTYSGEHRVDTETPPTYLVHAADDRGVPVRNALAYAEALDACEVPFALEVLPTGGHGFGMYPAGTDVDWVAGMMGWLRGMGW